MQKTPGSIHPKYLGLICSRTLAELNASRRLTLPSQRVDLLLQSVRASGISVEAAGALHVDAATRFESVGNLLLSSGRGDITLMPAGLRLPDASGLVLSTDQLHGMSSLTLQARDGTLSLWGAAGLAGPGTSLGVGLNLYGPLNLVGSAVHLQGSQLRASQLNITVTRGDPYYGSVRLQALGDIVLESGPAAMPQ